MFSALQKYTGFQPYKLDPKFRVSVPPQWRPDPGSVLFLLFSKEHDMPVIKVLSQEAFDDRVETVRNSNRLPAEKTKALGKLAMLCRRATLNEQGKLLIPKDLSEKAEIGADTEVMLAGRGMHFEVWNMANFDRYLEIETSQTDDEFGIY